MLKNKSFLVKMVNDETVDNQDTLPPVSFAEYMCLAREQAKGATGTAVKIVGAYVLADTLRQIAVHTAKTYLK